VRLISKRAFRDYMRFRGVSNKQLAEDVGRIIGRKCSETTIALLRSDSRDWGRHTAKPEVARGIEMALNAPPGSLFAAHVIVDSPIDNQKRSA
jgi:hypothetical protein